MIHLIGRNGTRCGATGEPETLNLHEATCSECLDIVAKAVARANAKYQITLTAVSFSGCISITGVI